MANLPLEGVRVLDLCVVWAGPWGMMQLADLGAEIIRVESMQYTYVNQRGNPFPSKISESNKDVNYAYADRKFTDRPWNRYSVFNFYGRGKKSMTVDLNRPEGKEIFGRLVKVSDAVIQNQAARNFENLGLTHEQLKEWNPKIIDIRFPGFGTTGPYKYRLGYGFTMDAITGHTSLRHYPDLEPMYTTSVFHGDACGGAAAAIAFLEALHYRDRTGKGQFIDMSQCENVIHTFAPAYMDYFMNGRVQKPIGNRDKSIAPQGCYLCMGEDSWCVLSIETDEQWQALCDVMERPDVKADLRFTTVLGRQQNHDEIDGIITEWTAFQHQYEVMNKLQAVGIPAGPVIEMPDVFNDPHLNERGHLVEVTHPEAGTHLHAGPCYKLSESEWDVRPAPMLGEHNRYVYKDLLGYSDDEIQHFIDEKQIGDYYLPGSK